MEHACPVQRQSHRLTRAHQRALLHLRCQPHAAGEVIQAQLTKTVSLLLFVVIPFLFFYCQTKVHGKDRVKFMETLVVADVAELKDNQVRWKIVLP